MASARSRKMFQARWSLTVTVFVLGALAAVDVRHGATAHGQKAQTTVFRTGHPVATERSTTPTSVVSAANELPTVIGACPNDMVEVKGQYCPAPEQICQEFISEKRDRCARFSTTVQCIGKPAPKHFCIDRYEYPNEAGRSPRLSITWDEARDVCENDGKRLCAAQEWTLACEGPERKPYPFGYVRDATACNFDKPYILPDNFAYVDPRTHDAEIARVNQSEPSGSRPRCVSDYGVYDMTGNVDEWVVDEHGSPQGPEFQSGLKGGYWGPVRNRCRPMTTDHNRWHHGYQIGFRCCKDVEGVAAPILDARERAHRPDTNNWTHREIVEPNRS